MSPESRLTPNLLGLPEPLVQLEPKKLAEVIAAMALEALSENTELYALDPGGGGEQLADFTFVHNGTAFGQLEVTTTTRPRRISFGREVAKLEWRAPSLGWSWSVKARDTARIKRLRQHIEPLLAELEAAGRTDGWIPDMLALHPADAAALPGPFVDLGVVAVCAFHHHQPGETAWIAVTPEIVGGSYSLSAVVWEVQVEVNKPDNQMKLNVPGSQRSELFVWLDVGRGQAALTTVTQPPFDQTLHELPNLDLPDYVTGAWAASGLASWPTPISALLFGNDDGWQIVEPPTLDDRDGQIVAMLRRLIVDHATP